MEALFGARLNNEKKIRGLETRESEAKM